MDVASLYPPQRGGIAIEEAVQVRSARRVETPRVVGGSPWLAQFVRARLTEVGLAIIVLTGIALPFERLVSLLVLSNSGQSGPAMLEVPDLAPGTYRSIDGRYSRLYVVRSAQDDVLAFTVPLQHGKVEMPAAQWGRSAYDCSDFGPDTTGERLLAGGVFRCRDRGVPEWGAARWRWHYDGSPAPAIDDSYIAALPRVKSVRAGALIRIYRWDILW